MPDRRIAPLLLALSSCASPSAPESMEMDLAAFTARFSSTGHWSHLRRRGIP